MTFKGCVFFRIGQMIQKSDKFLLCCFVQIGGKILLLKQNGPTSKVYFGK